MTENLHYVPFSQTEGNSEAEASIENGNYSQAVDDLSSCLDKNKDMLPKKMREIAATLPVPAVYTL